MTEETPNQLAAIEAVLFAAAKPIPLPELAAIFSVSAEDIAVAVQALDAELTAAKRGIRARMTGMGAELVSASAYSDYVKHIRQQEDRLSNAALETLSVIAFKQPVTKAEIEEVRGVNSEKVIKQLLQRELVTELGRRDTIGRPVLYGTTDTFLRSVGITSLAQLKQEIDIGE